MEELNEDGDCNFCDGSGCNKCDAVEEIRNVKIPAHTEEPEKTQENTSFVINEKVRQNSHEIGKASDRHKIYYSDAKDLKQQIQDLKEAGFMSEE